MNYETVLGLSTGEKAILIIVPPILGALFGWFMPTIAGWAIKIPFIPFEGVFEWIAALESQWISVIGVILGVIAGIFFVFYAFSETLRITITDEEVKLNFKEKVNNIYKTETSAIYMEGKDLVFLGTEGNELFRGQPESKKELISEAFRQHRYPWKEKDPFENQYQRWVADHPDFSPHVNALLSTRERALKNEEKEEAKTLRKDLVDNGIVIRDEDKRQYVRIVRGEDK
ncbi:50S ribosomal protein L29 [Virgibacillus indicus]|uniref:50S ribosomal protein L29 n=1 Tax=Virgibacillus indicus TaxID=2024554 RepID=A0A265N692_9BACI|nr:50S ribosomal protein L29 [Virgibacillus indicus]OZU87538.1 50S ribosomal protein L29 [Virgibacillus indicus]